MALTTTFGLSDMQTELEELRTQLARQSLADFLYQCHQLNVALQPCTGTKGPPANPVGRWYPKKIVIWDDFARLQDSIWAILRSNYSFQTTKTYPGRDRLQFLLEKMKPIGSEAQLAAVVSSTIEDMAELVLAQISSNDVLKRSFGINGTMTFEELWAFELDDIQAASQHIRNTRADRFCVLRQESDQVRPVAAIEYKAPHKVNLEAICNGLQMDLVVEQDIMGQHEETDAYGQRYLMVAVVTQLFSYMIDTGVRYGYVCTGQALVFVRIEDDPEMIYCHVSIPTMEYDQDETYGHEKTAIAQITAFMLQAVQQGPCSHEWIDRARSILKKWKTEYVEDILSTPETERHEDMGSSFEPSSQSETQRPLKRSRSRCVDPSMPRKRRNEESGSSEEGSLPPLPSDRRQTRPSTAATRQERRTNASPTASTQRQTTVRERQFCTHQCLWGLCQGDVLDLLCPNVADHGHRHMAISEFRQRTTEQLATDRGDDTDWYALAMHGSRGAMHKITLSFFGYTFLAKGFRARDASHLANEIGIYEYLESLQGTCIPVCLGRLDLRLPLYYQGVDLDLVLLLSSCGLSLPRYVLQQQKDLDGFWAKVESGLKLVLGAIHEMGVLHRDVDPRNIVIDPASQQVMFVDFERSKIVLEQNPLRQVSPNQQRTETASKLKTKLPRTQDPENLLDMERGEALLKLQSLRNETR